MLEKTNENLLSEYSKQNQVVDIIAGKLVKSVATHFVGIAICTKSAIPK